VTVPVLSTGLGPYTGCLRVKCTDGADDDFSYLAPDVGVVKEEWNEGGTNGWDLSDISYIAKDELVVHFGTLGLLYHYDGSAWKKIDPGLGQPQQMLGVGADLYADFGSGVGLYKYNGTTWKRINANDVTVMTAVGKVLYVHFAGVGVYGYDGSAWKKTDPGLGQPQQMLGVGVDLYADFGAGVGLYKYNGTTWKRINGNDVTVMVGVGNVLYMHFAGVGVYGYDGSAWKKTDPGLGQPQQILGVGADLYADFGAGVGLYKYNGTAWKRINLNDCMGMVAVDLY
jgi:membrane protein implicated in regulation of membrane protease activity